MATILLVDDDPLQAMVRKSLLEKSFLDVQRVQDAAEALCLIEQRSFAETLSLVISGHHRPGLGGPAFVAEVCARMPQLPVLVLGSSTEAPEDYPAEQVCFVPLAIAAEEMVEAAGHLVALHRIRNTGSHARIKA